MQLLLLAFLPLLAPSGTVRAQDDTPPPDAAPPVPAPAPRGPVLPGVLASVAASWPPDALAEGLDGQVLLEVDVSEAGQVLDARVLTASDPRFGGPARDAMLAFRFSPAIDLEGRPSAARIQYRYVFQARTAPVLSAEGRVRDAATAEPLVGLLVTAIGPTGERLYATTDERGDFRFSGLADGSWRLLVSGGGDHEPRDVDLVVAAGSVQQAEVALARAEVRRGGANLTILVEDEASATEVTERAVTAEEIEFLPGTSGDVVKAVQNQPGVARAPSGIGQLIIRGTPPEDSEFGLDGAPVPLVFHFAGLTTVLSTESIEEVAYLPGAYGVRYGRALGGYVDLRLTPDLPEEDRSVVSVDLYQAQLFTERRVGDRTAISASGRRSYADAVLGPLLSEGEFTVQAPRYWDAQARVLHETRRGDIVDATFLLSDDRFRFLGKDADGQDETLAAYATAFQKLRLRWLADLPGGWSLESTALVGPERQSFEFVRDSEAYEERFSLALREEARRETGEGRRLGTRVGVDLLCGRDRYRYDVAFYPAGEEGEAWFCAPAPYAEATARFGLLSVTPGVRADLLWLPFTTLASVDPRLGVRRALGPSTTLKAGTGLYSQFPTLRELDPESDGDPDLGAERAWQTTLGLERRFGDALTASLAAFYNGLFDLVVGREDRFEFFTGPPIRGDFDTDPYANAGTGLTCGVEVLARYVDDRTLAQLAATFSHSERTGRDGITRLFEYDQPVNLNLLASRELPREWRVGARIRFGSGNPYTPVANRIYDLASRDWIPVYDPSVSERVKPFFSLDVRVDRRFEFRAWNLTAYLDVQNATYYRNIEVMAWNEDYSEEDPVEGFPVFPSFGLKGAW